MTREIKYRAWDRDLNAMVPVMQFTFDQWSVTCGSLTEEICERNSFKNEKTDRHVLMQFTGLHDLNGKEIYEGDLVKWRPALEGDETRADALMVYRVVYVAPSWMIESDIGAWRSVSDGTPENKGGGNGWWENQIEVIGNIYEHPHLFANDKAA
jgi:uncharacterized phage protein (TIGR01671 family)